jgi:hypothetical protein
MLRDIKRLPSRIHPPGPKPGLAQARQLAEVEELRTYFGLYQRALCVFEQHIDTGRIFSPLVLKRVLKISHHTQVELFRRYPRLPHLISRYHMVMSKKYEEMLSERVSKKYEEMLSGWVSKKDIVGQPEQGLQQRGLPYAGSPRLQKV